MGNEYIGELYARDDNYLNTLLEDFELEDIFNTLKGP